MLDPDKITANLKTQRLGKKILVYDSTSSTQTIAAEYARNKGNDGLVIFAEQQTAGRGRAGNQWHASRSDSILCSVVLTQNNLPAELLSITCAVAVAETVGKPARSHARPKAATSTQPTARAAKKRRRRNRRAVPSSSARSWR